MTRLGSELERDLVSPFRLRGDQVHRELALRRVCGSWILARRVQLGDVAASRPQSRAAAPRSAVMAAHQPYISPLPERFAMLGHNRKMSGAECMADMLKGYGVTHVFHVPAVLRKSFVEMERRTSIARVHTHGEKSAAYMADGYARASGRPGVCAAQVIGALN